MRSTALLLLALLAGCGSEAPATVTPASGPSSGYYAVTIDLGDEPVTPSSITSVRFGSNKAYDLVAGAGTLTVTVQGEPQPGPVDVKLVGAHGTTVLPGAFTYEPPRDPRLARVVAMGASLTQGVQNGVPSQHGSLMGPIAQTARQMGAYFPLPLLVKGFMPEVGAGDIGPPPACAVPDIAEFVAGSALSVLGKLAGGYDKARVDADIDIHDVAVGGFRLGTMLRGPDPADFGQNFVARLVYAPYEKGAITTTEIELVEALDPTVVMITDAYANDVVNAILGSGVIDPSQITPEASIRADLEELLSRLSATGADVFIANMPRPSVLPATSEKKARMIEDAVAKAKMQGGDEQAAADAAAALADQAIADTDAAAAGFDQILVETAMKHARVHVVDAHAFVEGLAKSGVDVGGVHLTPKKFGGLLSFDGVHFSNTGYALFANVFIAAVDDALGTALPPIDVARILAEDPAAPAVIAKTFDASKCAP